MEKNTKMKRLLLIVDPQIDFISGSLPVPGADEAMDRLADYIKANDGRYCYKIVTADRHPYAHCSFSDNGGQWPRHCVRDSQGAAIWPSLFKPLFETAGDVAILYKGQDVDEDQYSIFSNPEARETINTIICDNNIERIDICGLAGDVCVASTLKDGEEIYGKGMFRLLTEFSPTLV